MSTTTIAIPRELLEDIRFIAGCALSNGASRRYASGWDPLADPLMKHGAAALATTWQDDDPRRWFGPDYGSCGPSRAESVAFVARWYRDTMQEWVTLALEGGSPDPEDAKYVAEIARAERVLASTDAST